MPNDCLALRRHAGVCSDSMLLVLIRTVIEQKEQLLNAVGKCVNDLGGINILVANSSIFASDTEAMFSHHALGPIRLAELVSPYIRREASRKPSAIIFISSLAARMTFKGGAAFCASKHAVLGFAGCLFEDLREDGIKVSTILRTVISASVSSPVIPPCCF